MSFVQKPYGQVELTVYPEGGWQEWHPGQSEQWASVSNAPVSILFESKDKALAFKQTIQSILALLEPAVGFFASTKTQKTGLSVLTDSTGSLLGDPSTKMSAPLYTQSSDQLFGQDFFDSPAWSALSKKLTESVGVKLQEKLFERNIMNTQQREKHKKSVEEYTKKEDEYKASVEDEEIRKKEQEEQQMIEEMKIEIRREQEAAQREADAMKPSQQNRQEESDA